MLIDRVNDDFVDDFEESGGDADRYIFEFASFVFLVE